MKPKQKSRKTLGGGLSKQDSLSAKTKKSSIIRLRYTLPVLFVVLLIFLKLPLLSIYFETVRLIITLAPMAAIVAVACYAFYHSNRGEKPNRLGYYLLILKILLAILAFYILYAPGEFFAFLKSLLNFAGSVLTLEGLVFLSGPIAVISFLLFAGLLGYRSYQAKLGTYTGSITKLFKRLSFTLFFLFMALGSTIVMASPGSIKPMTDYLGDTIFTLSGGHIQVLKGTDVSQYKRLLSLKEMTSSLSTSLVDTSKNFSEAIEENKTVFKEDLSQSAQELASSISETTEDLKDKLEEDIDDKLPLGGGTLSGKLTIGKDLTVRGETEFEDTVNANDFLPNTNDSYDLGSADKKWRRLYVSVLDLGTNTVSDGEFSGDWNFSGGNLSNIGTLSADSYNGLTLSSGSGTLDLGSYSLVLSGNANLNQHLTTTSSPTFLTLNTGQGDYELYAMDQNVLSSSSPTFSGLTLSGDLALGSNTLTTDNTDLVSNLNADLLDGQHGSYYLPKANVSGTDNYLAKFNGTDGLESSVIYESGGNIGIGTESPDNKLTVAGDADITGNLSANSLSIASGLFEIDSSGIITAGIWQGTAIADAYIDSVSGSKISGNISGLAGGISSTLAIAYGGTGATTAGDALNNLLPSQTGNSSKFLQTDGEDALWENVKLSDLDDPDSSLALSMGSNTFHFTFGSSTGSSNLFTIRDSAENTGSGYLVDIYTGNSSLVKPFRVSASDGVFPAIAVDNVGYVGIGTESPDNKLTVSGDADITGDLGIGTDSPTAPLHIYSTNNPQLKISYDSSITFSFRLDADGNVIFTTTGDYYSFDKDIIAASDITASNIIASNTTVYREGDGRVGDAYCQKKEVSSGGIVGDWTNINNDLQCGLNKLCDAGDCIETDFVCGTSQVADADSNVYDTVRIGDQCWIATNLNVGVYVESINTGSSHSDVSDNDIIEKYCYNNTESNCDMYGGLYDWDEAMGYVTTAGAQGICPDGWHIPTDNEIKILEGTVDSTYGVGDAEWDKSNEYRGDDAGTNLKTGDFGALLAGYRNYTGSFYNLGSNAYFWTSSESSSTNAWSRHLASAETRVDRYTYFKTSGFSVRCLKD